jgi:hypothetical protein
MRYLFLSVTLLILSGCAASLTVDKLQDFKPSSKVLVLTNSSRYDAKIRKELAKKGFKVLKFASTHKVITEGGNGEIARVHNEAEARYGITFYWEQVDRCIYNTSKLINGTFEITDIRTNEVLLVIEKGGWTGPCADPRGMVFEDLAQALSDNWGK